MPVICKVCGEENPEKARFCNACAEPLEEEMREAAKELRFEYAARLRDEINDLKRELKEVS